ncbi:MAG TPA: symmetrical bis(5'-nucleosyl)-tetraphosphatase [Nitrospiraceae bacterium]|nr:symmetrical bis(5'-nucleosyl)-tetraphosphatase [Nitrospiraceae bacterium]
MATYAIGDVQGCFSALQQLVDLIGFNRDRDRLWFVGDLVNRGPDSLSVLRWVKNLGESAVTVLGNHDLYLLAVAEGVTHPRSSDTLKEVLTAPDRRELLAWLRQRPFFHLANDFALIHAGLLPQWTVARAATLAAEVEAALQSDQYRTFLGSLYDPKLNATCWTDDLAGPARLKMITNVFTRIRVCTETGAMDFSYKGPLAALPPGLIPWFQVPHRQSADTTLICGHWAALGLHVQDHLLAIDTGCVWGNRLTAVRLEDRQMFHAPCA